MLSIGSALWSPAEQVDGFTNTALNVDFCATKTTGEKYKYIKLNLVKVSRGPFISKKTR